MGATAVDNKTTITTDIKVPPTRTPTMAPAQYLMLGQ